MERLLTSHYLLLMLHVATESKTSSRNCCKAHCEWKKNAALLWRCCRNITRQKVSLFSPCGDVETKRSVTGNRHLSNAGAVGGNATAWWRNGLGELRTAAWHTATDPDIHPVALFNSWGAPLEARLKAHLIVHILGVGYGSAAAVNEMQVEIKADNPTFDTADQMPFCPNKWLWNVTMDQFVKEFCASLKVHCSKNRACRLGTVTDPLTEILVASLVVQADEDLCCIKNPRTK